MVMPSSSDSAVLRPHIGSGSGWGTFAAVRPESQWPAVFPTQQGIVLDLVADAPAIGASVAINDRTIVIAMTRLEISRLREVLKSLSPQRRKGAKMCSGSPVRLCVFAGKIFMSLI